MTNQAATGREKFPPLSNRGGRVDGFGRDITGGVKKSHHLYGALRESQEYERYATHVIDAKGNLKEIPLRRGKGNIAFIDTLSFTFHESAILDFHYPDRIEKIPFVVNDLDKIVEFSFILKWIFGFGVSSEATGRGGRFYERRFEMAVDGVLYGQVYIGGQNETLLVELTGKGCEIANDGWEKRLYKFLNAAHRAKITRCDVACDFYAGELTPDSAYQSWLDGEFDKRGKRPIIDRYGSDWDCGTNNGKTLYIGSKHSGIYARVYDKAKEQGDKSTFWTRFELQFMGKNVVIDLDILLQPGQFFGGAFPICERLAKVEAKRVMATSKRLEISVQQCKDNARNQAGRAVNMMLQLGMSAEEIVEELRNKQDKLPERVNPASYVLDTTYAEYLHDTYGDSLSVEIPDEYALYYDDYDIFEQS